MAYTLLIAQAYGAALTTMAAFAWTINKYRCHPENWFFG